MSTQRRASRALTLAGAVAALAVPTIATQPAGAVPIDAQPQRSQALQDPYAPVPQGSRSDAQNPATQHTGALVRPVNPQPVRASDEHAQNGGNPWALIGIGLAGGCLFAGVVVTRRKRQRNTRGVRIRSSQLLLAAIAALALAAPAAATQREPQEFETIGHLTSPSTAAGTWTGTGPVEAAGTYEETFRFAGNTIHSQKVLVSAGGTIVLEIRAVVVWLDACTAGFKAGNWHISGAIGAYGRLKGGGAPAATAESFGNVCTGVTDVVHEGAAHDH